MKNSHRQVIVIETNPLLQEGLRLLLQDLQCDVSIVRNNDDLKKIITIKTDCPQLIVAPISLQDSTTDKRMIEQIRVHCKTDVPVIFLEHQQNFEVIHKDKSNNIYFSDCSNPKQLKRDITDLLNHPITYSQH